jgi:tripartite-type tricarboxylate transporter receptor subunit TctC
MGYMRRSPVGALITMALWSTFHVGAATAQSNEPSSFRGKTVTMILGDSPGGGTDLTGRLIASFLSKYLPGEPVVVARNMPGAGGMTAMNYLVSQTKPDGLTITVGATPLVDPKNYRSSKSQYDPAKFVYIGGIMRGGIALVIGVNAERRLYDRSADPATIGAATGTPRNATQMALWGIEYLGWNAKWVTGYAGTSELMLALARGEIDMTTTGDSAAIANQIGGGHVKILAQTGIAEGDHIVPRPDFGNAPVFSELMRGRLSDPVADKAFQYWVSINGIDKFAALMPGTPAEIIAAYRAAFDKMAGDPDFIVRGKGFSDDFVPMSAATLDRRVQSLASTPNESIAYISRLLVKQGLNVE